MPKQKSISELVKQKVLLKSKRRCALCFIEGISEPQIGNIAHIVPHMEGNTSDNLVYLCSNHHHKVDLTGSPKPNAIKEARAKLYEAMAANSLNSRQQISLWTNYEELMVKLLRATISDRLGDFFELNTHALFRGRSGVSHEVDLAVEFAIAGLEYLTIFEVKYALNRVNTSDVLRFAAVGEDIRANKCVIVSSAGFSVAAEKLARSEDITLLHVPEDARQLPETEWRADIGKRRIRSDN